MKAERAKAPKAMKPWKGWVLDADGICSEVMFTRAEARALHAELKEGRIVRVEVREVPRG